MNLLAGLQKLPITRKLNPFNRRNLLYLAEIAVLTRLMTAVVRVDQNRPSRLKDPRLTDNEKRLAFIERFFVEILGTVGYMIALHLGQDITSKFFEKKATMKPPQLADDLVDLGKAQTAKINEAITKVYGNQRQGMVHRILYGEVLKEGEKTVVQKASLSALRKELGEELFTKARPYVDDFARRANVAASISVLGGVVLSALFGGFVTQWINDRVASPAARRYLTRKFGDDTQLKKTLEQSQKRLAEQSIEHPQPPIVSQVVAPQRNIPPRSSGYPPQQPAAVYPSTIAPTAPPNGGFRQYYPNAPMGGLR